MLRASTPDVARMTSHRSHVSVIFSQHVVKSLAEDKLITPRQCPYAVKNGALTVR
jgi:hypothetical protein